MTPFILGTWNGKIHRTGKAHRQMPGARGQGEVMGTQCLRDTEFQFRKAKNLRWIMLRGKQQCGVFSTVELYS